MSNNLTDVDNNNRDNIVNIKNNVNNVNSKNNNAYSNLDRVKNLYIKKTRVNFRGLTRVFFSIDSDSESFYT